MESISRVCHKENKDDLFKNLDEASNQLNLKIYYDKFPNERIIKKT